MSVFYPTVMLKKITDLTLDMLREHGVSALILDVDNTLATPDSHVPDEAALRWLDTMKNAGIELVIASNNTNRRVGPLAETLGISYVANSAKPLAIGFAKAAKRMNRRPESFGVVGDQIFTDVLGGNLFGAKTFLIQPIEMEKNLIFRFRRKLEAKVLKSYRKKMRQTGK